MYHALQINGKHGIGKSNNIFCAANDLNFEVCFFFNFLNNFHLFLFIYLFNFKIYEINASKKRSTKDIKKIFEVTQSQ